MEDKYPMPFLANEVTLSDAPMLRQPFGDQWEVYSWKETGHMARKLAKGLKEMGLGRGSHIGLVSKNCREWVIADLAIMMIGAVSVPFYPNLSGTQLNEVIRLGDVEALFVGKVVNWDDMRIGIPKELPVIAFPHYEGFPSVESRYNWNQLIDANAPMTTIDSPSLSDTWTIVFTSGTTGTPKGVVLTYGALDSTKILFEQNNMLEISADGENRFFSYLPLNHIAERVVVEMTCLSYGGSISFVESLDTFAANLRDVQPTAFFAVPRIWTKFQLGILSKLPQAQLDSLLSNPATADITAKNLRLSLGLDQARGALTGAAPMPQTTKDWFKRIGIHIHEGYGMTENSAITTALNAYDERPGSVGQAQPGAEIRIDPETNEILMRAPYLMKGYYKDPAKTAEVLKDGWLHTGDEGRLDENGYLFITGRIKDTFKTAKGKFIVPAPIEWEFSTNADIEQICVMGLGCPQPIVMVCLSDVGKSKKKEEVEYSLSTTLSAVNSGQPNFARISTIVISNLHWSADNGLLTPTLKVKRNKLHERYGEALLGWHEAEETVVWEE